jgi:7-cyano-7-deazaguanine synthase
MNKENKKALILLSGGLDSVTTAAIARAEGYSIDTLTFNYGQRHNVEIALAEINSKLLNANKHVVIDIPIGVFSSALTGQGDVPRDEDPMSTDIPVTYVPARNILFLSYAVAYAESHEIYDIFIGANAVDYSGYPDCRPEFFHSFQEMINKGTKAGVEGLPFTIHTPIIDKTKAEIIKMGIILGVDYSLTHSCYDPDEKGLACGHCDSCILRRNGFIEAEISDPTRYS